MKNQMLRFLAFGCLLLLITACQKDKDCIAYLGINGEWTWVKSVGGIAGSTLTPETENLTRTLEIDDFKFREYVNDTLAYQSEYDLDMDSTGLAWIIYEDDGRQQLVEISETELKLHDAYPDGFSALYERK